MTDTPHANAAFTSGSVMIVDDERAIRATVTKALRLEGLCVFEAGSADECLQLLRNGFQGVILMDVMMPVRDGWDLVREIRDSGLNRGILIVMLTAMDEPSLRMDGLQEMVIDYMTKPFGYQELTHNVSKYLGYLADAGNATG